VLALVFFHCQQAAGKICLEWGVNICRVSGFGPLVAANLQRTRVFQTNIRSAMKTPSTQNKQ